MRPLLLSSQKFYLGGKYSMNVSERGKNLIKSYEGCRLEAYYCPSGVLTIGYGHTGDVYPGQVITQAEADALFDQDIVGYVNSVRAYEDQLNQNQFDALVSFCYNVGNIDGLTGRGTRSIPVISTKMLDYNKSGGKVLSGLTKRRKLEQQLFNTPVFTGMPEPTPSKSLEELADEVIAGKWGNGSARKQSLTAAGYDYKAVQTLVNYKLKNK